LNRVLVCGLALLLTCCGAVHTVPKLEKPLTLVKISMEQNGAAIVLRTGEALRVILPGNPQSGYLWEVAQLDDTLLGQAGQPVFVPSVDPGKMEGFFYFTFPVIEPGITPLRIVYHRANDMARRPLKSFLVLVTIKDK
jgi:predicted secreted protein